MHELCIMDHSGDIKLSWDPDNQQEIAAAKASFEAMKKKGYMAYVMKSFSKGEVMHEFDPKAKRIIMSPAMQGG